MNVRSVLLSVEAMGKLSNDEDVIVILREVWMELKAVEREANKRKMG